MMKTEDRLNNSSSYPLSLESLLSHNSAKRVHIQPDRAIKELA